MKDTATASTSSKSGEELPSMQPSSGEQKGQMQQFVSRKDQQMAEIRWALKTVMSHYSLNSAQDKTDVFHTIFPDSNIAKRMSCDATKLSYLITFGIAPFFKQELLMDVSQAPCFVISFDESLNPDLHEEQMDFIVRFIKDGKVEMRYLGSAFLGYTTAADLKRNFDEATKDLDKRKMIQVSMDGPNVNWKLLSSIVDERQSNDDYPQLLDIGSCSLHVIHGAFWKGMNKTNWGIDSILKALHNLFDKSLAKWLEDKKVADRALEIRSHITTYISEILKKLKHKIPATSSFVTVRSAVHDPLMPAKLAFFASTASIMLPYLQIFQSDAPLVPFVISELQTLLEMLMGKFVKWKELEKLDSASKISQFDVSLSEHHVASKDIDVGFAAKSFDKLIKDKKVSDLQVLEFRKECQAMLVGTVTKIQEWSPLKFSLARKLISVDPRLIATNPESAIKMFQQALQQLIEAWWNTPGEGDTILAQFRRFIAEAQKYNKDKFASFQHENMWLDCFYSWDVGG